VDVMTPLIIYISYIVLYVPLVAVTIPSLFPHSQLSSSISTRRTDITSGKGTAYPSGAPDFTADHVVQTIVFFLYCVFEPLFSLLSL